MGPGRLALGQSEASRTASWTARVVLLMIFCAHAVGGAVGATEAMVLVIGVALASMAAWVMLTPRFALASLALPALALAIVLVVAAATTMPLVPGLVRSGLLRPVGGSSLSIAPDATLAEMMKLAGLGCAFLCGGLVAQSRGLTQKLMDFMIALTVVWAIWAISLFALAGGSIRLGAPFLSPNTAATLLTFGVVMTLGRLMTRLQTQMPRRDKRMHVSLLLTFLVLFGAALVMTQSRAGVMIAVLSSVALLAAWPPAEGKPRSRRFWITLGAGLFVGLAFLEASRGLLERLQAVEGGLADRGQIFALYWRAFLDSPIMGSGLGTATYLSKLGLTAETYEALWNIQSAHNWVLQWLSEAGLAGAAPMWLCVGLVMFGIVSGLDDRNAAILVPLILCDIAILLHGLVDFGLQIPSMSVYWSFLLGLQFALANLRPRSGVRPDQSMERPSGQ